MNKYTNWLSKNALYLGFAVSLMAMLGSLFFSNVMGWPPCVLCWYQRICLYPLVAIFAVGIVRKDEKVHYYAWPFIISGLAISIYHNLLYWKLLPESAAPCLAGVSCTTKFIEWFGFVTIPFLAFIGFVVLAKLMFVFSHYAKRS